MHRITFDVAQTILPADPIRMDVACFIGFVPMRSSASGKLPAQLYAWLSNNRWLSRVEQPGDPLGYDLLDVPVPIESWEGFQALFAGEHRLDDRIEIHSAGLGDHITITPDDAILTVSVDGKTKTVTLPGGTLSLTAAVTTINAAQVGITAKTAQAGGQKHLVLSIPIRQKRGHLTVFTNPALGFPRAMSAANDYVDTYLSSAVRSFFAQGGRKCYVVRMGDALALDAPQSQKIEHLAGLLWGDDSLWQPNWQLNDLLSANLPRAQTAAEPRSAWHGIAHILGLPDVTYISLPDIPDLLAEPAAPQAPIARAPAKEMFVECAPSTAPAASLRIRRWDAPRCSETGFDVWARIVQFLQRFVKSTYREMQLVASLPLPHADLDRDFGDFVGQSWFAGPPQNNVITSKFVQLGFPWLKTTYATALPGGVEPPEGALIGLLAANALTEGAYTSAAGTYVRQAYDLVPQAFGVNGAPPTDRSRPLRQYISIFVQAPQGIQLDSDVTCSADPLFEHGAVRRLIALIVRAARHQGCSAVFEPQSMLTWQALKNNLNNILMRLYNGGGLRGRTPKEAFNVTCDRNTMTQNDIDNGRLIAHISVLPAVPIERISITLMLENSGHVFVRRAG